MAVIDLAGNGIIARLVLGLGVGAALILSAPSAWSQSSSRDQAGSQEDRQAPLDALHQALHLSSAQEPGWQAYRAQAAAPSAAQDRRRAASQMFASLAAPQRMDLVEAEMRQELTDLQRQSQALKAFYATLTPQQKTIFDAQTLPPRGSQQQGQ